jgi:hypothetical protein
VGLKGGICAFLWDRDNRGRCSVTTHLNGETTTSSRQLLEGGVDVFIRFNEGLSILKKVVSVESGQNRSLILSENKRFDELVSSRKPFGLDTTFKGKAARSVDHDILIYQNGGIGYVDRKSIKLGLQYVDKWKIFVGYAAPGTGNKDTYPHKIISTPFIGGPGTISSETYLCIGPFNSESEAANALSYLSCRLPRLLILLHKPSQHVTRKVYKFVPTQDWSRRWTDAELYTKYGIVGDEIKFIESMIRPMAGAND